MNIDNNTQGNAESAARETPSAGDVVDFDLANVSSRFGTCSVLQREEQITLIGTEFHDAWRAPRWKADEGRFDPRIKTTTDAAWIEAHGGNQVDIANCGFAELPADWQKENRAAAEQAWELINRAVAHAHVPESLRDATVLPPDFVRSASRAIHDSWVERNRQWAPDNLKKPFDDLPPEEQEKDIAAVRAAARQFAAIIARDDGTPIAVERVWLEPEVLNSQTGMKRRLKFDGVLIVETPAEYEREKASRRAA